MAGGASYDEVLDRLVSEFDVDRGQAARDLDEFLRDLEAKGILTVGD